MDRYLIIGFATLLILVLFLWPSFMYMKSNNKNNNDKVPDSGINQDSSLDNSDEVNTNKDSDSYSDLYINNNKPMTITSTAFSNNESIPSKYTCNGENISPPIEINSELQAGAVKSLALIIEDPDAPSKTWTHWLLWNINPAVRLIEENSVPKGATVGKNDFGQNKYGGPCPPSGTHRYFFKVYGLDSILDLDKSSTKQDLEDSMVGHILEEAELIGTYSKK